MVSFFYYIVFFFAPWVVIQLYNINQQNAPFLNQHFNFFDVFYMFHILGFIFRKMVVYTGMVLCVLHALEYAINLEKEHFAGTYYIIILLITIMKL